jgi:chromosome segregation ATPase
LEQVVEASANQFGEVNDIIMRHDTLMSTLSDLQERARFAQERHEHHRRDLASKTEVLNNTMLSYTNQLATLQDRLEDMQRGTQRAQQRFETTLANASQKNLLLGQTKM